MAAYAIMRMNKCKLGAVTKLNRHHERLKEQYKSNPDIDVDRSWKNYHIIQPAVTYRVLVLARIEAVGAKRRRDSVVMQDCLVTASPEWINGQSQAEQEGYFQYAYEFFEQSFGRDNILSAVVHMDEATPHMHLAFVPITEKGKLSSKEIIGGPTGLVRWQDKFYEHIHKRYPDLTRGIPAKLTHRKHLPSYLFKNAADLYKHYEEIQAAVNNIGLLNSKEKKGEALELLARYAPQMAKLTEQVKQVDGYIKKLKADVEIEQENTRYWKGDAKQLEQALAERDNKIYELSRQQKKLEQIISRIPPDIWEEIELRRREQRQRGGGQTAR